jgi:DNA mismatch repair protein MutS2
VRSFLELGVEIARYFKKAAERYPYLQKIGQNISPRETLLSHINATIDPTGTIYDNASPELKRIRKEKEKISAELHIRMERLRNRYAEFLQEDYITIREERLVLPVREFSAGKVPGIVHGQSGSGSTYFIEPLPVVELNNDLQKILAEEHKEIIEILKRLTRLLKNERSELLLNLNIFTELDVLLAMARYARKSNSIAPEINPEFGWRLIAARHPLLYERLGVAVEPLQLELAPDENVLVISGPNAGGKTVTLKTVGLLQLMFQCGFHLPVGEGSKLPVAGQWFVVVGDDQSIEQDLSTFSSHVQALNGIIRKAENRALILIDEIGNGTEPDGSAALAVSFLEYFNRDNFKTLVTTHLNQLKIFGSQTAGIVNAAMQFDNDNLKPLYRLEKGIPGSSYTFEICHRLGLHDEIVQRAIELRGSEHFQLDKLLTDVVDKSRHYQDMIRRLSIKESELAALTNLYESRQNEFNANRKKLEKEAQNEAVRILEEANRQVEQAIREIRETQADKQVIKKVKDRLAEQKAELREKTGQDIERKTKVDELAAGMAVRSIRFKFNGTISKIYPAKNEAEIEGNGLKIKVPLDDLQLINEHGSIIETISSNIGRTPDTAVSYEINLRGFRVDEALLELETYLDRALLSDWSEIRIVHGKGTGALKTAIHQFLKANPAIKSFRLGHFGEGDSGVTVVTL